MAKSNKENEEISENESKVTFKNISPTVKKKDEEDSFYDDDDDDDLFLEEEEGDNISIDKIEKLSSLFKKYDEQTRLNNAKTKLQKSESDHYDAVQKQKEKQRKAIKAMLEHTSGNIPALFNEVNTVLKGIMAADKKLEFDKPINFSEETASFRIPKFAESFNLDGATDFFGMSIAEQELLFDRIGLFKGIVVDHTKETPVEQGFRNAVKYLKSDQKEEQTKPVTVFYKKPRLSGFFETNYSLDEGQKKSQEAGIFNLGFGLSVDVSSWSTSVGVRAGFSYGKDQLHEKNSHFKKVSIISNFFLPKIELSFDTLNPCADDNLVSHLERVFSMQNVNDLIRFEEINKILHNFGHFVPTSLVIGGRLYSSDTKEIKKDETIDNILTKYAANFQLGVSTRFVEVGIEGKMSKEDSAKTAIQSSSEKQNLQLNAIGGEGAYVNDTTKWVKSTEKYTTWGLVRFDNLVPIIDILPSELQEKCNALFDRIVKNPEISIELLLERNAHFLFYKGYLERFGKYAQPKFYLIKNNLSDNNVLSISNDSDVVNFNEVTLKPYERKDSQLWYVSQNGKIYSREKYEAANKFVLSLEGDKMVVTMEDYFDNQYWSVGGGIIKNESVNKFLVGGNKTIFEIKEGRDNAKKSAWLLVSEAEFENSYSNKKKAVVTNLKLINKVDTIRNGDYFSINESMVSDNLKIEFKIINAKLVIKSTDLKIIGGILWEFPVPTETARVALVDGKLIAQNNIGDFIMNISNTSSYIQDIKLLSNGNFEAIDRSGAIVWESNSIIYSTIKKSGSNEVLSIHHSDFEPNMSYSIICVTTYPFADADHQLWYVNRNNQIVSKANYSGKQFALTCDQNGSITLNPIKILNSTDQKWRVDSNGYGVIENQAHSKKLKSAEYGKILNADSNNENWEIISKPDLFGKTKIAKIKRPTLHHVENTDYYNFYNNDVPDYIHNDTVNLNGNAISGIRIFKYTNRYALEIETRNKSNHIEIVRSSTWEPFCNKFEKSKVEFQKSVLYLEEGIESVALNLISSDKIGIRSIKRGAEIKNSFDNCIKMENSDVEGKIKYVDLNWVRAEDNEKVIGIGFGITHNRLCPYIVTIPK